MSFAPYGSLPGFSLAADMREIAAYYAIRSAKTLRRRDPRASAHVLEAKDALYWKLTKQRSWSPERVGAVMKISGESVRQGAARHAARIELFRAQHT